MSRQGGTCGAVTGGLMAVGLATGRRSTADSREPAYAAGAEIQKRFLATHGTLNCRDLTGCDLSTPAGQELFKAKKQDCVCCLYLELVARSVVELAGPA